MTEAVKNFIETNYLLLDTDPTEFCHSANNGLSIYQQKELINALNAAGINIDKAREQYIHFHITMTMDLVERPVSLRTFVDRYFVGILGFNHEWLLEYIKDNKSEWDDSVEIHEDRNGNWMIYPKV
jgi:hypothetical protein